jgi:hypothetical protein
VGAGNFLKDRRRNPDGRSVFESFGEQLDFNQIVTAQVLRRFARQCNWEGDDYRWVLSPLRSALWPQPKVLCSL